MSKHTSLPHFLSSSDSFLCGSGSFFLPQLRHRNDYKYFLERIQSPIVEDWDFRTFLEDVDGMRAPLEAYRWTDEDHKICNHLKVIFDDFRTPEAVFKSQRKEWQRNHRPVYTALNQLSFKLGACVAKNATVHGKVEKLQKKSISERSIKRRLEFLTAARLVFRLTFRRGIDRGAPRLMVTLTHAPKLLVTLYRCGYKTLAAAIISFFLECSFHDALNLLWDLFDDHPEPDFRGESGPTVSAPSPKAALTKSYNYYPPKAPPPDGPEEGRKRISDEDRWRVGRYLAARGASQDQILSGLRLLDEMYPRILSRIRFLEGYVWRAVQNGARWKKNPSGENSPHFHHLREDVKKMAESAAKGCKKSAIIEIEVKTDRILLRTKGLDPTVNVLFFNRVSYREALDAISHLIRKDPILYPQWTKIVLPTQELRHSIASLGVGTRAA